MTYASSTFKDLTTARAEVTNRISSLQEDLGHIDATIKILKSSHENGLNGTKASQQESPQIEDVALKVQVENIVPVGTSTKINLIATALQEHGIRSFRNETQAYNQVCSALKRSSLFKRVSRGVYQRIESGPLPPDQSDESGIVSQPNHQEPV